MKQRKSKAKAEGEEKKINDDIVESIHTIVSAKRDFPFNSTRIEREEKGEIMDNENNCKHEIH